MPDLLRIEAPSDAQLAYIAGLCEERGLDFPPAVYSKCEASEIIAAILQRQYDPDYYLPSDAERFANGETMYDPEPAAFVTDYGEEVPF